MTKYNVFIKDCYIKGYRVTDSGHIMSPSGDIRKLYLGKKGYYSFGHRMNGSRMTLYVHSLCAYQKFGELCFDSGIEVRHLDGDSKNNSPSNIDIGTHSDNMNDVPKKVRVARAKHASSFIKKHNHEQIRRFQRENNSTYKQLMDEFGITSKGTISYIMNKT